MAAPMRLFSFPKNVYVFRELMPPRRILQRIENSTVLQNSKRFIANKFMKSTVLGKNNKRLAVASFILGGTTLTFGIGLNRWKVNAKTIGPQDIKPSRSIQVNTDNSGLKLTLYQFQTCPFCCKTRALLDYYGFSYDVVEVNSVTRKQIKWSDYRKVPVLVADNVKDDSFLQLNESSVIMSILESYLINPNINLEKLKSYYPCIESKDGRKKVYDFPNKYFIMYGEKETTTDTRKNERLWRSWADDHLVHILSPNVYRTISEAIQSFRYFSEVGEWEKNFSTIERLTVIYVGAAAMYIIGKLLKRKYELKEDVRESLYDACNEWVQAIGKKKTYMGGDNPDLSDLVVYGILSSIEGCAAFQDTLVHTKIGPWYNRMKHAVQTNQGASIRHNK